MLAFHVLMTQGFLEYFCSDNYTMHSMKFAATLVL